VSLLQRPLDDLLAEARALRQEGHGRLVTYSPKVFIPLTKLCRDVCHYCTFARPPRRGERAFLTADEVLEIAHAGATAGCHEALFTLGDKPELRYRAAREELAELGCATTIEYLARMCELVLAETGLLPHANPGVMSPDELALLRGVSVSQGIMLETSADRLSERGGPHFGSPDKVPARRLETLDAAGALAIPFTTGILIGIGETRAERLDALLAIREVHERHGHIQEVIVQNFRAKADTKMAAHPEPPLEELLWTAAVARIVLGPAMHVQAPPNLSYDDFPRLLEAGIDDWGGVSPVTVDHVNPEAPWPEIERLRAATEAAGLELAPRLAVYPDYVAELDRWTDPRVARVVLTRSDASGLAREDGWHAGSPVSPPAGLLSRAPDNREAPPPLLQNFPVISARVGNGSAPIPHQLLNTVHADTTSEALAKSAEGLELDEDDLTTLFEARGRELAAVLDAADRLRQEVNGDTVSYVVTRNVNYTNVCYFRCGFCAFSKGKLAANLRGKPYVVTVDEIARRAREAWERGAVEICLQGGIHPAFTGDTYLEIAAAVKDAVPGIHVHAFSALEVWQGAATLGLDLPDYLARLRDAGLASLPGTAAEILDDGVRAVLCPDKVNTTQWLAVHDAAHRAGLASTTTVMFGAVERTRSWARHLIALREQQKASGGFTEFVPLPFVHMEAPIALKGNARSGPTFREALLMHAVGRLGLHPWITNIQASWVKLGAAGAQAVLRSGANDLGGTLMNESISRAAGAEHGQEMPPEDMEALIREIGRTPRQRTTLYATPDPDRTRASFGAPALSEPLNPSVSDAKLRRPSRLVRPGLAV
jgi:FO synthase